MFGVFDLRRGHARIWVPDTVDRSVWYGNCLQVRGINQQVFALSTTEKSRGVQSIRFTQMQARGIANLTPETLRHWRRVIPFLAVKNGKTARFTLGELVAVALTRRIVDDYGLSVAQLSVGLDEMMRLLSEMRPSAVATAVIALRPDGAWLYSPGAAAALHIHEPMLLLPCSPVVADIQARLLPGVPVAQPPLPFQPREVARKSGRADR